MRKAPSTRIRPWTKVEATDRMERMVRRSRRCECSKQDGLGSNGRQRAYTPTSERRAISSGERLSGKAPQSLSTDNRRRMRLASSSGGAARFLVVRSAITQCRDPGRNACNHRADLCRYPPPDHSQTENFTRFPPRFRLYSTQRQRGPALPSDRPSGRSRTGFSSARLPAQFDRAAPRAWGDELSGALKRHSKTSEVS